MDVLSEIIEWAKDRPDWQRDALRRLVQKSELDDVDVDALTEICKSANGLSNEQEVACLREEHLTGGGAKAGPVTVHSIFHKYGVNALAENQTLKFGPGLTVVYGDNAAGKSGYARVFKSACRARGTEDILGNVFSETVHQSPIASIVFSVGNEPPREWTVGDDDEALARVGVFDRHSEAVYTREKTDVAFRPFGLDLYDKLAQACASVRKRLQQEQNSLGTRDLPRLDLPKKTAAAEFLSNLSLDTTPHEVKALVTLSKDESIRLDFLRKQLLDLQSNYPDNYEQVLMQRSRRLRSFSQHLSNIGLGLSSQAIKGVIEAHNRFLKKQEEAEKLQETAFQSALLPGTGSTEWTDMWEAGRSFSEQKAYPNQQFPFTDDRALCVLCQQQLEHVTARRLTRFEQFVTSNAERSVREAKDYYERLYGEIVRLKVADESIEESIRELRLEDVSLADAVENTMSLAVERRKFIIEALANCTDPGEISEFSSNAMDVETLADQLEVQAKCLRKGTTDDEKEDLAAELEELEARQSLGEVKEALLSEIDRLNKIAAYEKCKRDTDTRGITAKSSTVTKEVVTQQLKTAFQEELDKLNFRDLDVELKDVGGQSGNFYHKLILSRAPGVDLPSVISEGQSRCLSIAAFFAELRIGNDSSAILFDDPVSSLDYRWRDRVALRLVDEASERQLIVFTHDIFFLHRLRHHAGKTGLDIQDQHVQNLENVPGVCEDSLPWEALRVRKRIGYLRNELQRAEKLFRTGKTTEYEREARYLYSLLRTSWERGLEEVLLNGVVERFRPNIETGQISSIADIKQSDCETLKMAMTKCSELTEAHDHAPTARLYVPEPSELEKDIDGLDSWVKSIQRRRKR